MLACLLAHQAVIPRIPKPHKLTNGVPPQQTCGMPQANPFQSAVSPKLLHIFKPGKWTAMSGESIEFSSADLAATAKAFDPSVSKAPIVIGHPATDDPAKGWISSLVANERGLFAQASQVDPAFAEAARAGRYGTLSAKFYRPTDANNPVPGVWYLRHLAALGAAAPGVKGLASPAFAEGDEGVCFQEGMAYAEYDDVTNASLWRRIRDWFIADKGLDVADAVVPAYMVQSLEQAAQDEVREAAAEDAAKGADTATPNPQFSESNPKESTVTEQEAALLRTQSAQQATRINELEAREAAAALAKAHADNTAFCEGLAGEGRLLPAYQAIAVATLDHFATQVSPVEFGEGEAKAPLAEGLRTLLKAIPKQVEFGEHATADRAGQAVDLTDGESISAQATAVQAKAESKGQTLSHAQAVSQVVRGR